MRTKRESRIVAAACWILFLASAAAAPAADDFPSLRLEGTLGGVAADEVGPGRNTGIYVGGPTRGRRGAIAGDADSAAAFRGTGQHVRVPVSTTDIGRFGTMLEHFTIEFWYRSAANNRRKCLVGSVNNGQNTAIQVERSKATGRFNLLVRSQGGPRHLMRIHMSPDRSAVMADGRFHHVAWVVASASAGKARAYLDGKEDTSATVSGSAAGGFAKLQHDLAIGASNVRGRADQFADATLDEVALYPQALTAARIKRHYASGISGRAGQYARGVLSDRPFAYWRLGESSPKDLRLLLDGRTVERIENAVLRVGRVRKHPANPLFGQEHPWEVMFNNLYPNVLYDRQEKLYKAWHTMFVADSAYAETTPKQRTPGTYMKRAHNRQDGLGYATSIDGIRWMKPMMNVHPWKGKPSNLVARHVHGVGILKDLAERDPARRYKMFFKGRTMSVRFSPDGVRWGAYIACPEIEAAGDTHNNVLWIPELKRYVGFTRHWNNQRRTVARTESRDFIHWTESVEVFRGKHLFDVYSMPVFRYGGIYLGFPAIFDERADRVHTELAWSTDTIHWKRIDEGNALIPNSPKKGDYDWGTVYASFPIFLDDEIRLYYGGCDGGHFDWRDGFLCLATLRPDGFAGYEPVDSAKPGIVITRPVTLGGRVRITADAEGGSITVSVLDEGGNVLLTSRPVTGNVTDRMVSWESTSRMPKNLVGKNVRLRFEIRAAKLYSFLL